MHSFRRVRRLPKSDDATSGVRDPTFEFKSLLFTRGGGKKRGEEEESSGFGCFSHLKYIYKKKNLTRQERLTWEITQDVSISRYSRLFITGTAVTQAAARLTITLVTRLRILLTTGIVLGFTQPWSVRRAAVTRKVKVAERETNQRTPNAKAVCPKLVLCKCSLNSAPLCDCHSSVQKVYA